MKRPPGRPRRSRMAHHPRRRAAKTALHHSRTGSLPRPSHQPHVPIRQEHALPARDPPHQRLHRVFLQGLRIRPPGRRRPRVHRLASSGEPPAPANLALAIVLLAVFFIQAAFNMWQDWSSSRVMASIKTMLPEECMLIRDGVQVSIMAAEIVPGDVLLVKAGNKLPADVRFTQVSSDAKFDRGILTGNQNFFIHPKDPQARFCLCYFV